MRNSVILHRSVSLQLQRKLQRKLKLQRAFNLTLNPDPKSERIQFSSVFGVQKSAQKIIKSSNLKSYD
jgi:hypothetical protein